MSDADPNARIAALARENRILRRRLERASDNRAQLELIKDKDRELLKTIYLEMVEQRALIDRVLTLSPVAIGWKDATGTYLGCNLAYASLLGASSPDEVVGRRDDTLVPPALAAILTRGDELPLAGLVCEAVEVLIPTPTGSIRTWLCSKVPLPSDGDSSPGVLAQYHDITAQKAAEAELLEAHEQLEATLSTLPDVLLELEGVGRILKLHIGEDSALWPTLKRGRGRELAGLLPPEAAASFFTAMRRADAQGSVQGRVFSLPDGKGGTQWFELSATSKGRREDRRYVVLVRDISSRVRAEEESRRMESELLHRQKLESLGVLAGGIAHDFNNILTTILGNANLALEETAPDTSVHTCLQGIELGSKRAAELCDQLLAYTGKGHFSVRSIDLSELVRETLTLFNLGISKKAQIALDLEHDLPTVIGDRSQLQQVILNLVVNASDALGESPGTIALRTRMTHLAQGRALSPTPLHRGDYLVLQVQDTGSGMSPETLDRIFDPFFTTKFTGRGLGLAATLGIVGRHLGGIEVASSPGQGTTFSVYLPAADTQHASPRPPESAAVGVHPLSGKVLLADDEDMVRRVTERMLRRMGLEVITASDGGEAVERFRQDPDGFSVVLLDLTMPRLGGVEALEIIQSLRPDIPSILSSGFSTAYTSERFHSLGISGFLHKPYTLEQVQTLLRRVLTLP